MAAAVHRPNSFLPGYRVDIAVVAAVEVEEAHLLIWPSEIPRSLLAMKSHRGLPVYQDLCIRRRKLYLLP